MKKTKSKIALIALICGLVFCFAVVPQKSAAQGNFIPPGSYQKTCSSASTKGALLNAVCATKGNWSGQKQFPMSNLHNYFLCDGDIWNDDGNLKCKINVGSPLMKSAASALDVAFDSVTGSKISNKTQTVTFVRQMFEAGLGEKFYNGLFGMGAQSFLENWLSKPENAPLKAKVIEQAFKDVYSTGVSPKDLIYWKAQKVGYGKIAFEESKKLNQPENKVLRRLMILAAYKKTMGRPPVAAEYDYWTARPHIFKQLVEASREYLYTTKGGTDLIATIKRALADKLHREPTTAEINDAIIGYSKNKNIYDEM